MHSIQSLIYIHIIFELALSSVNRDHPLSASKGEFKTRVTILKEQLSSKENEIHGKWMTEDRMKKSGEWSPHGIKSIKQYCEKFPETLCRYPGLVYQCLTSLKMTLCIACIIFIVMLKGLVPEYISYSQIRGQSQLYMLSEALEI